MNVTVRLEFTDLLHSGFDSGFNGTHSIRKLAIHDITKNDKSNFTEKPAWAPLPKFMRYQAIKIRAYVYQCKDLPAADSDGTSDPYIKIWDMSETEKQT